jgi:hypothetical protein
VTSSHNGSHGSGAAPGRPRGPAGLSDNLTCTAVGCAALLFFLLAFLIGLAHPLLVIAIGALIMLAFGGALLLWRD